MSTVKLDVSPSLGWGNLAISQTRLCYYHKASRPCPSPCNPQPRSIRWTPRMQDNVYSVDCRAIEGRVAPTVDKVPLVDTTPSPVTGLSWCVLAGVPLLVVTTKAGFGVWNADANELLAHVPLAPADVSTEEGAEVIAAHDCTSPPALTIPPSAATFHFARGIAALPASDELAVGTSWGTVLLVSVPPRGRGDYSRRATLKPGHKAAIAALAADDR